MAVDNIDIAGAKTYFAHLEVNPQGARRMLRRIDVPGQNGVAYLSEEKKPVPFKGVSEVYVPTTLYAADNAASLRAVYDALVGEMVTLNAQSVAYLDILVLDMNIRPHVPLVAGYFVNQPDSTEMTEDCYLVTADWDFIFGGVVP